MSVEILTVEKIKEIITVYELDRNTILKDIVNNGDSKNEKSRRIRMLESLTRNMIDYKKFVELSLIPEPEPEPVVEPEPEVVA